MDPSVASFTVLAVVLAITPGADTMVVLKNTVQGGTKRGLMTMVGVKLGTVTHALLASLGLAAVLVQYSALYSIIKYVGAAYLVWLGVLTMYKAIRGGAKALQVGEPVATSLVRALGQGYLSNVLNPKVVLFYVAVLPQFVQPTDPVLLKSISLGAIHIVASATWLTLVALFVGALGAWIARPRVRRVLDSLSGFALLGFGLRVALSK